MPMEKVELVFIPAPLMGHIGQAIELANKMTTQFNHLSVTILIMKFPGDSIGTKYTNSLASSTLDNRVNFIHFPPLPLDSFTGYKSIGELRNMVLDRHKPLVRDIFSTRSTTHRLAACIVSMLCTSIMDVVNEFGLPTYVFFASNAAYLGAMLHFQLLHDNYGEDICELANSDSELAIPSYVNPIPPNVLPFPITDRYTWHTRILPAAQKCREAKGIIVNTFSELEHHALCSYDDKTPPVYAIGPILKPEPPAKNNETLQWLKDQPKSSVVLLCFGSRGSFSVNQVREIATAVERSGYRFIWSLRRPSTDGPKGFPCEYTDFSEVLPDGLLERTAKTGKVIGWIPQQVVLSNTAIGGFVTHCGWNSVLESLWHGVPLATCHYMRSSN
ncbi:UDP-glycoslytransferase 3 [Artemisia annua]|uniref:UDP-glycoslytransferase 3 n=1 Tax=Artemisia annua TaxID=35608 RepID=A0A2U1NCP8_ARTAN|nr:UDP-glycoslytransferase 3 [Artemisia annua]